MVSKEAGEVRFESSNGVMVAHFKWSGEVRIL